MVQNLFNTNARIVIIIKGPLHYASINLPKPATVGKSVFQTLIKRTLPIFLKMFLNKYIVD